MNEKLSIPQSEYREREGLANSELQLFRLNPAMYQWNIDAPADPLKTTTKDMGTALHVALLEPDTLDEQVFVSSFKGRTTQGFQKEQEENSDKIVLTEIEYDQIRIMALSAMANPLFAKIMNAPGDNEVSIFVDDTARGIVRKIRPDRLIDLDGKPLLADLKKTADISKWRSAQTWINPLFDLNYAYTAAYYMDTLSLFLGEQVNEYCFPIVQSNAALGRYPSTVFTVSREQLVEWGIWADMEYDLDRFALYKAGNLELEPEQFPEFRFYSNETMEIEIDE